MTTEQLTVEDVEAIATGEREMKRELKRRIGKFVDVANPNEALKFYVYEEPDENTGLPWDGVQIVWGRHQVGFEGYKTGIEKLVRHLNHVDDDASAHDIIMRMLEREEPFIKGAADIYTEDSDQPALRIDHVNAIAPNHAGFYYHADGDDRYMRFDKITHIVPIGAGA